MKILLAVQQILEKLLIYKLKLLLKSGEDVKIVKGLESGHSCQKYGFFNIVGISNAM